MYIWWVIFSRRFNNFNNNYLFLRLILLHRYVMFAFYGCFVKGYYEVALVYDYYHVFWKLDRIIIKLRRLGLF